MESFSYSNPYRKSYGFGLLAFTAALTTPIKPPPRASAGRVCDIHVRVTIIFTQVTTPAYVRVGVASDTDKYAELNMGAAAAGAAYNFRDTGGTPYNENLVIFSDINLARDGVSVIQVAVVAPTGGSPTGTGFLDVDLAWF